MKNFILLGAPGSGKGSQSARLVDVFNFKHISTGDLLRSEVAKKTELGLKVSEVINSGLLVSDSIVIEIIKSAYKENGPYLFDGFPRNLKQAHSLVEVVFKGSVSNLLVIYFDVDFEKIVNRIENRRICKKCGSIYNLMINPSLSHDCEKCSSKDSIEQRKDDKRNVIMDRLDIFKLEVKPMLDYFSNLGCLRVVDANLEEAAVFKAIQEIM
jgi:adenylate kinase